MEIRIPEDSITAMCRRLSELSGGRVIDFPGYTSYQSDRSMFYARHHITAGSDRDADSVVASIVDQMNAGGPRLVSYTEEIAGRGFGSSLKKQGFINFAVQTGMILNLRDYEPAAAQDASVCRIDARDLEEWSAACSEAFGKPPELPALQLFINDPACRFYACKLDGRIVATAMTCTLDENCGIHEVGTLPAYRGRGICSRLIRESLAEAKSDGVPLASLQASPAGASVYAKIGFRAVSAISGWIKIDQTT